MAVGEVPADRPEAVDGPGWSFRPQGPTELESTASDDPELSADADRALSQVGLQAEQVSSATYPDLSRFLDLAWEVDDDCPEPANMRKEAGVSGE